MDPSSEESTSLKPRSPGSPYGGGSSGSSCLDTRQRLQMSRQKRRDSIRLPTPYFVLWSLLIATAASIPLYEWLYVQSPHCWEARYGQIMFSVFVALTTGTISGVLAAVNAASRTNSISLFRLTFCTVVFLTLVVLSALNFLTGVYFFALPSCYFAQIIPPTTTEEDEIAAMGVDGAVGFVAVVSTFVEAFTLKYDLKIAALLHLLCTLLAFAVAIAFAIIKNNFKYVRQMDFD